MLKWKTWFLRRARYLTKSERGEYGLMCCCFYGLCMSVAVDKWMLGKQTCIPASRNGLWLGGPWRSKDPSRKLVGFSANSYAACSYNMRSPAVPAIVKVFLDRCRMWHRRNNLGWSIPHIVTITQVLASLPDVLAWNMHALASYIRNPMRNASEFGRRPNKTQYGLGCILGWSEGITKAYIPRAILARPC